MCTEQRQRIAGVLRDVAPPRRRLGVGPDDAQALADTDAPHLRHEPPNVISHARLSLMRPAATAFGWRAACWGKASRESYVIHPTSFAVSRKHPEMVAAIDAVCNVAERIIGKLKDGAAGGGPPLLGAAVGNGARAYPPTPAMKRFADSLARKKGIKPPPGYKTSISICSAFLKEHAPKKAEGETTGKLEPKPVSPAQMFYAKRIAQEKGVVIPDEAKANSAAMSAWIDSNRDTKRRKRGRKTAYKPAGSTAPGQAQECQSEGTAIRRAEGMSRDPANAGAVAFKRAGDPNVGEFSDAVVLKKFGDVPEDLSEL